jgi:hypothetical protein
MVLNSIPNQRESPPPGTGPSKGPLQPAFQVIYLSAIVDILTSHFEFPDARFLSGGT